jgi:signal transduction histidine kinase
MHGERVSPSRAAAAPGLHVAADPTERALTLLAGAGGALVAVNGALVIGGWFAGVSALTRVAPGLVTMTFSTAACLLVVGLAITVLAVPSARGPWTGRFVWVLAGAVALVAVVTLLEDALDVSSAIDNPFGFDPGDAFTPVPGRMAQMTAVSLVGLSTALVLCLRGAARASQTVAGAVMAIGFTALIGYAYGVRSLYRFGPFNNMAVNTATAVVVAGLAVLLLRPGEGHVSVLLGDTAGGVLLRRLLPWVVLAPTAVGGAIVVGLRDGRYDGPVALSLFVTIMATAGAVVVWVQGDRLRAVDLRRVSAEGALAELRDALAAREQVEAELAAANADLSEFAAIAAHDLRSPLATVQMQIEILQSLVREDPSDPDVLLISGRIEKTAERGVALIDDLLAYASIGREPRTAEAVDLTGLARTIADEHLEVMSRPALCEVRPIPLVAGDRQLLGQLLGNLIGNALKYVPSGRTPSVVVDAVEGPTGADLVLRVTDNGDGFDADEREHVFDMFRRGRAGAGLSGTGIGLAICRRVAEHHGGRIWIESRPVGARICVQLPRWRGAPPAG